MANWELRLTQVVGLAVPTVAMVPETVQATAVVAPGTVVAAVQATAAEATEVAVPETEVVVTAVAEDDRPRNVKKAPKRAPFLCFCLEIRP